MKYATFILVFFLNFLLLNNLFGQKKPPRVEVTVYLTDGDSLQGTTLLQKGWLKGNFIGTSVSTGKTLKDFRRFYTVMVGVGPQPQTRSDEQIFLVKNDKEVFDFSSRGSDYEAKWRKKLWDFLAKCPDLVEKIKPGMYHTYPSNLICEDYEKCVSDLKN